MRTRREVWGLGDPWNDTVLWYARGVEVLRSRPLDDPTGWRFIAAMHGISGGRWRETGYLADGDAPPADGVIRDYWQQCQHQTWYFLPWHRAYLLSFERIVLAAIVGRGGPADWALPYWNYSDQTNPNALELPPAFTSEDWPDGDHNPLFEAYRFGTGIDPVTADLSGRLDDSDFEGAEGSTAVGVGGPRTPFSHFGDFEGLIEAAPHDLVHGDIGGVGGLMSNPNTAALDPLFWLHHANIDRLWEVWRRRDADNKDPDDPDWRGGPADRAFVFPAPAGGPPIPATPAEVADLAALGYGYEDVSDPLPGESRRGGRLLRLDLGLRLPGDEGGRGGDVRPVREELMGASDGALALGTTPATATLRIDNAPASRLSASFTPEGVDPVAPGEPDRVFLTLEGIKGSNDAATFDVFVAPRAGGAAEPLRVGTFSLFGLEEASDRNSRHGGRGLSKVFEITDAVDRLKLAGADLKEALDVRIEPRRNVVGDGDAVVGQLGLVRRSG